MEFTRTWALRQMNLGCTPLTVSSWSLALPKDLVLSYKSNTKYCTVLKKCITSPPHAPPPPLSSEFSIVYVDCLHLPIIIMNTKDTKVGWVALSQQVHFGSVAC